MTKGRKRLNRVRARRKPGGLRRTEAQLAADETEREQEAQEGKKRTEKQSERERERGSETERERGDRFACSAACPACPCAVGGMLHVELTARIYILLARIFISVRGRLTSSMTGGRDAWCLAWLCLTAFLRTSLRRATAWRCEGEGNEDLRCLAIGAGHCASIRRDVMNFRWRLRRSVSPSRSIHYFIFKLRWELQLRWIHTVYSDLRSRTIEIGDLSVTGRRDIFLNVFKYIYKKKK